MTSQDNSAQALIIDDGRIGNLNQLRAIAEHLEGKIHIKEKKIHFTKWIKLPNFINILLPFKVSKEDYSEFKSDIVFSAGRRSAIFAAKLKKHYPQIKIIQLMRPNLASKYFDYIITPKHDNYAKANYETLAAPNFINDKNLNKTKKSWPDLKKQKNICAVIIGGDTKKAKVSDNDIKKLCSNLLTLKQNLVILTSRRTSTSSLKIIKEKLAKNATIYDWEQAQKNNPYLAVLGYTSNIIVTADSVSMVGDALSTGKPTYICREGFGNKKHHHFIDYLLKNNLVKNYQKFNSKNSKSKTKKLNEAEIIANKITKKFL